LHAGLPALSAHAMRSPLSTLAELARAAAL